MDPVGRTELEMPRATDESDFVAPKVPSSDASGLGCNDSNTSVTRRFPETRAGIGILAPDELGSGVVDMSGGDLVELPARPEDDEPGEKLGDAELKGSTVFTPARRKLDRVPVGVVSLGWVVGGSAVGTEVFEEVCGRNSGGPVGSDKLESVLRARITLVEDEAVVERSDVTLLVAGGDDTVATGSGSVDEDTVALIVLEPFTDDLRGSNGWKAEPVSRVVP